MKRKSKQTNLVLLVLLILVALLLLPQLGVRAEPLQLLNRFGITSRDLLAAIIGAGLMYLFLQQRS